MIADIVFALFLAEMALIAWGTIKAIGAYYARPR